MANSFKYSGELNQPIPHPKLGPLASDEALANANNAIHKERYRRMALLFDAHGVAHGNWEALCFSMADAHVAGFSIAKDRRGPKTKWDAMKRAELYLAVEETGLGITEATEQLAKQEPWAKEVKRVRGGQTLYDEYFRADMRNVELLRKSRAWSALPEEVKQAFLAEYYASIGTG